MLFTPLKKYLCQLLSNEHTKQRVCLGGAYHPHFSEYDDTATAVISSRAVPTKESNKKPFQIILRPRYPDPF